MSEWWREAVVYQVYPRSFADGNGDGHGDLPGLRSRLDYLEWLGVDAVWLNPTFPSPNADWGYDVADYCGVHPDFGTLADLDALVADAAARGIRVLLDFVPNHTSDRHPWFLESRSSRGCPKRDWYVWADPRPDGGAPTNWAGAFGGPAWTYDERTRQYYLHSFLPQQPELNWWNPEVREKFDRIVRFWFERGIAGFRIDVVHRLVKTRHLVDVSPPVGAGIRHAKPFPPADEEELHSVIRRWRALADGYEPQRLLLGETWVLDVEKMVAFYGTGEDELHLAFNFPFLTAALDAAVLSSIVDTTQALIPAAGWPVWTLSNHDVVRFPTRWCRGDERKVRCALLVLLALRGTPVLYYGDEIGMRDVDVAGDEVRDCARPSRDPARTPMQWSAEPGAGFTTEVARAWLPLGDHRTRNVETQRSEPASTLSLCRDLIALRRDTDDLRTGRYRRLAAPPGAWAWRRGREAAVAVNLSDGALAVDGVRGRVALATDRGREGERVAGRLELAPWSGAIVLAARTTERLDVKLARGGAVSDQVGASRRPRRRPVACARAKGGPAAASEAASAGPPHFTSSL